MGTQPLTAFTTAVQDRFASTFVIDPAIIASVPWPPLMLAQVQTIAEWLGTDQLTEFELVQTVRQGLPLKTQAVFLSQGMTKDELRLIVIPKRTYRTAQIRSPHTESSSRHGRKAFERDRKLISSRGEVGKGLRSL
jgi:hypothetical protein